MIEEKIIETFGRKKNGRLSEWYESKVIETASFFIRQTVIEEAPNEEEEIKQPPKQLELEVTLK